MASRSRRGNSYPARKGRKKPARKNKSGEVTTAGAIVATRSGRQISQHTLPFLSLPPEIQLTVFEMILLIPCAVPHYGTARAHQKSSDRHAYVSRDITSFLMTCHTLFDQFGPLFWQRFKVYFTDPVNLADSFLSRCSEVAYNSLRHLHYTIDTAGFGIYRPQECARRHIQTRVKDIRKLTEIVCVYRELNRLRSIRLELLVSRRLAFRLHDWVTTDAEVLWRDVDRIYDECFSHLEKSLLKRTFRGFHVYKRKEGETDDSPIDLLHGQFVELYLEFMKA